MSDTDDLAEALRLLREVRKMRPRLDFIGVPGEIMPWSETVDDLLARHPEPVKLKPCPCCGGVPSESSMYGKFRIQCTACGLKITRDPANVVPASLDARNAWNRRAP